MEWMIVVTWFARAILFVLILMSVYALSIILRKKFFEEHSLDKFEEFWIALIESGRANEIEKDLISKNPFMAKIHAAFDLNKSIDSTNFLLSLKFKSSEEGKVSTLGTFGATAPFIGLLGTVFGIIVAFGELSSGKVDSNSIMYALAEALILTAVGLVVAIPSVMSFNHYSRRLKTERTRSSTIQALIRESISEKGKS